jgi:hypothetical protein
MRDVGSNATYFGEMEFGKGGVSTSYLIDYGPVAGLWDGLAGLAGCIDPCLFGLFHLLKGFLWSLTEGGAGIEVRNISNVSLVLLAVKDVDVIISHPSSSSLRV